MDRSDPPPPPPSFRKTMLRFLQRNFSGCSDPTLFLYRKSATKFFGSEMTPPLRKFSENSSNMVEIVTPKRAFLKIYLPFINLHIRWSLLYRIDVHCSSDMIFVAAGQGYIGKYGSWTRKKTSQASATVSTIAATVRRSRSSLKLFPRKEFEIILCCSQLDPRNLTRIIPFRTSSHFDVEGRVW